MEEDEVLPQQQEDDGQPEDRQLLLAQLKQLGGQPGPASLLLQAGYAWLQGNQDSGALLQRADELEPQLQTQLEDPILSSQWDRLHEGLESQESDQVLYALLGLAYQLKACD